MGVEEGMTPYPWAVWAGSSIEEKRKANSLQHQGPARKRAWSSEKRYTGLSRQLKQQQLTDTMERYEGWSDAEPFPESTVSNGFVISPITDENVIQLQCVSPNPPIN